MDEQPDLSLASLTSGEEVSAPTPERVFTEEELQSGVESGTITEAGANQIRERQRVDGIASTVVTTIEEREAVRRQATVIDAEVGLYVRAMPEVKTDGSPQRAKVEKEFKALVGLGYGSKDPRTELLALKAAFGPPDMLPSATQVESHQEGGSGLGSGHPLIVGNNEPGDPGAAPQGLTARQQEHYEGLISKGIMSDWNAVRAEVPYMNSALARRAELMNS